MSYCFCKINDSELEDKLTVPFSLEELMEINFFELEMGFYLIV